MPPDLLPCYRTDFEKQSPEWLFQFALLKEEGALPCPPPPWCGEKATEEVRAFENRQYRLWTDRENRRALAFLEQPKNQGKQYQVVSPPKPFPCRPRPEVESTTPWQGVGTTERPIINAEYISPLPQDVEQEVNPNRWMEELVYRDVARSVTEVWLDRQRQRRSINEAPTRGGLSTEDILRHAPPEWAAAVREARDAWKHSTLSAPYAANETDTDRPRVPDGIRNLLHGVAHLSRDNETHHPARILQDRMVEAYDCTVPSEVRPVKVKTPRQCQNLQLVQQNSTEMTILLLQKARLRRVMVRECSDIRSELAFQCGNFDHMTYLPARTRLGYSAEISAAQCRRYWSTKKLTVHEPGMNRWRTYDLETQATNNYMYQSVGSVTATDTGYYWEAQCVGGYHQADPSSPVEKARLSNVNSAVYGELTLQEHQAVVSPQGSVSLALSEIELTGRTEDGRPCSYSHGHCRVGSKMYTWEVSEPSAHDEGCDEYQRTRGDPVKGRMITTEDDQMGTTKTFVSSDGAMIRLVQKEPVEACGTKVWSTNYDLLYFTEWSVAAASRFPKPLHPSELSIATYSNLKDDFLYESITKYMGIELSKVLQKACEDELADRQMAYGRLAAEQAAAVSSSTAYLGKGRYVTASGEAWYQYSCRPILATALDKTECYDSLPVQLAPKDLYVYLRTRGMVETMDSYKIEELGKPDHPMRAALPEFFVSPITRMVGTKAAIRPCSPLFQPLYVNVKKQWIRATPGIEVTTAPQELFSNSTPYRVSPAPRYDMEGGGVYDVEKIRGHEMWMLNPQRGLALVNHLARKDAEGTLDRRHLGDVDPLTGFWPDLPWFPYTDILWTIWEAFEAWSRVCMLAFGAYVVYRLLRFLAGRCVRVVFGFRNPRQMQWRRAGLPRRARRAKANTKDWWHRQRREGYSLVPLGPDGTPLPEDTEEIPRDQMSYSQWKNIIRDMARDHWSWREFNRRTRPDTRYQEPVVEVRRIYPQPDQEDTSPDFKEPPPSTAGYPSAPSGFSSPGLSSSNPHWRAVPSTTTSAYANTVVFTTAQSGGPRRGTTEPRYEVPRQVVPVATVVPTGTTPVTRSLSDDELLRAQGLVTAGLPAGGAYLTQQGAAAAHSVLTEGWGPLLRSYYPSSPYIHSAVTDTAATTRAGPEGAPSQPPPPPPAPPAPPAPSTPASGAAPLATSQPGE